MGGSDTTVFAALTRADAESTRVHRTWRSRVRAYGSAALVGLIISASPAGMARAAFANDGASPTSSSSSPASTPTTTILVRTAAGVSAADATAAITGHGGTETDSIDALHLHVVDVPTAAADSIMNDLRADSRVASVSLDRERAAETAATDPSYGAQWALPKIG